MRTTITIENDVLAAARELARRQGKTVGEVISELARQALQPKRTNKRTRNGVPVLPVRPGATPVTPELVDELLEELS